MDSIKTDKHETESSTSPLKYPDHNFKYPSPKIEWHHNSANTINRIKSLKPKNSVGYDGIPLKVLKISSSL